MTTHVAPKPGTATAHLFDPGRVSALSRVRAALEEDGRPGATPQPAVRELRQPITAAVPGCLPGRDRPGRPAQRDDSRDGGLSGDVPSDRTNHKRAAPQHGRLLQLRSRTWHRISTASSTG